MQQPHADDYCYSQMQRSMLSVRQACAVDGELCSIGCGCSLYSQLWQLPRRLLYAADCGAADVLKWAIVWLDWLCLQLLGFALTRLCTYVANGMAVKTISDHNFGDKSLLILMKMRFAMY